MHFEHRMILMIDHVVWRIGGEVSRKIPIPNDAGAEFPEKPSIRDAASLKTMYVPARRAEEIF